VPADPTARPTGEPGANRETPATALPATQTNVDLTQRLAPGTLIAGRYRIRQLVGLGGMGVVYRAHDEELGVEIALKVLRPDLGSDPRIMERFRSELILARQVTHRNVVRIHDIGEHEGLRFLTMRYVEGRSLREILERDGRLEVERAVRIVRQVAEGLAQAHEAGVVHRDLKPANLLIDAQGDAFITDFGVARSVTQAGVTREGAVVGTPDYLSPEQITGEPLDGRSDLYALGILLFEMLSGELPFRAGSSSEMLAQRLSGRPRDLSETGVRVAPGIRAVIRRCLERNPSRRYPSASALIADLDRGAASPRLRARRWVPLLAAVLLLAAGGGWLALHRPANTRAPAAAARASSPAAARHAVAVLPLQDETADPGLGWTSNGIPEILAASLGDAPDLRVIESLRVRRTLRDLRLGQAPYDDRTLRQLAELWGVDRLVTGTVRRSGQRIRVDLSLTRIEQAGPTARAFGVESDGPDGLFRAAENLGGELRRELGLERPLGSGNREPETRSLEAARAYEEGRSQLLVGNDVAAAPALERAVGADPKFAAALEALSQTYQSLGYHERAVRAADQALRAVGTGDSRLGYRIRGRAALLAGSPAEAEKNYRELAERYPYDTEARLDLAVAQAAQGHHAQAVETLKRVVALDPADPRGWFLLGKSANFTGETSRAVGDYLVRALALQSRLGNEKGKADVLNAIGVGYQQLGDYPKALENYTAASALRKRLGDERGMAATLRNRALVFNAMGKPRNAESDLRAAREGFEKIGDRQGLSDVLNDFGFVEEGRADYARALEAYQQALKIRRELGDERLLSQSYDNVGYIFFLLGEYDNALVYWQQALDLRRKIGEKNGVVLSVQNLGFLQLAQGKWDEALRSFAEALEESREIDFKNGVAISLGNLGNVHHYQGRYKAALASYEEALSVSRGVDFKPALAEFTLAEAETFLELGGTEAARAKLDAAESWIRETDNREQGADLEVLRGEWLFAGGETESARRSFARAIDLARQSKSKVAFLRARIASARRQGRSATANLEAALREAESLGHTLLTIQAAEGLSRAELAGGQTARAEKAARRALDIAERAGWSAGLYRLYALLGRILDAKGDRSAAAGAYARSAGEIIRVRGALEGDLLARFNALETVREVEARRPRNGAA
jgi:tetratricopeptide (TPR) repeat protein/TolB-like protein